MTLKICFVDIIWKCQIIFRVNLVYTKIGQTKGKHENVKPSTGRKILITINQFVLTVILFILLQVL